MDAFPMLERCFTRQWESLTENERESCRQGIVSYWSPVDYQVELWTVEWDIHDRQGLLRSRKLVLVGVKTDVSLEHIQAANRMRFHA
jgi:hypothetical protein